MITVNPELFTQVSKKIVEMTDDAKRKMKTSLQKKIDELEDEIYSIREFEGKVNTSRETYRKIRKDKKSVLKQIKGEIDNCKMCDEYCKGMEDYLKRETNLRSNFSTEFVYDNLLYYIGERRGALQAEKRFYETIIKLL